MNLIEIADRIAAEAHNGQTRFDGSPYINHPRRVAERLRCPERKVVALLHDVLEDTGLTEPELLRRGIPEFHVNAISALTKRDGEDYAAYLERVRLSPLALEVKIADMLDNLADAPNRKQVKKYADGLAYLLRYTTPTP